MLLNISKSTLCKPGSCLFVGPNFDALMKSVAAEVNCDDVLKAVLSEERIVNLPQLQSCSNPIVWIRNRTSVTRPQGGQLLQVAFTTDEAKSQAAIAIVDALTWRVFEDRSDWLLNEVIGRKMDWVGAPPVQRMYSSPIITPVTRWWERALDVVAILAVVAVLAHVFLNRRFRVETCLPKKLA
jgi:hypothetical protein